MLVLGVLLVIIAALVTLGAIVDANETASVEVFGQGITTTAAGVFVAGLATMLVFLLGVWLIYGSLGRARRKRAERKEAKRKEAASVRRLEEEQAELRRENERLNRELESTTGNNPVMPVAAGTGAAAGAGTAAGATADGSDHDHDTHRTGAKGLMDKVTGRDHGSHDDHTGHDHAGSTTGGGADAGAGTDHSTDHGAGSQTSATETRVIDGRSDTALGEPSGQTGGRHRDG